MAISKSILRDKLSAFNPDLKLVFSTSKTYNRDWLLVGCVLTVCTKDECKGSITVGDFLRLLDSIKGDRLGIRINYSNKEILGMLKGVVEYHGVVNVLVQKALLF